MLYLRVTRSYAFQLPVPKNLSLYYRIRCIAVAAEVKSHTEIPSTLLPLVSRDTGTPWITLVLLDRNSKSPHADQFQSFASGVWNGHNIRQTYNGGELPGGTNHAAGATASPSHFCHFSGLPSPWVTVVTCDM